MNRAIVGTTCAAIIGLGITADGVTVQSAGAAGSTWHIASSSTSQVRVFTERCEHEHKRGNDTALYAEHEFENAASAVDIARARVLGRRTQADRDFELPMYTYRIVTDGIAISDGAIAVHCGSKMSGYAFDEVKIIVPRSYKLDLDQRNPW